MCCSWHASVFFPRRNSPPANQRVPECHTWPPNELGSVGWFNKNPAGTGDCIWIHESSEMIEYMIEYVYTIKVLNQNWVCISVFNVINVSVRWEEKSSRNVIHNNTLVFIANVMSSPASLQMKYLHSNELPSNSQNASMANITRLFCRGGTGVRVASGRKMIEVCQYKWGQLVSVELLPIGYYYGSLCNFLSKIDWTNVQLQPS